MARGFGGLFKAKDGYIRLASFSPRLIDDLREYMGVEEVTEGLIEEMVKEMTRDEAVSYFVAARVPVAPVYKLNDVVEDEHLIERNMFKTVQHKKAGPVKVVNFPVKFSETPIQVEKASPIIGEHNESVLRELLGYGDAEIDALKKANAIAERPQ